jgi:hypothetical protein
MHDDFSRQSFLGSDSQRIIENVVVGIVGLGGGGSHIAQQLAHIGFLNYVLVDPDLLEVHNLNRLIGGTHRATTTAVPKTEIAGCLVHSIRPKASISARQSRWQDCAFALRRCDVIFAALDGFSPRRQLEAFSRRHLIPMIDIGMDVIRIEPEPPQMAGQVILSMPGYACMHCMGFLNERALGTEAARYGDAGPRPQVVWTNGILASAAVGICVDLFTDWTKSLRLPPYLSLRGNALSLSPHARVPFLELGKCSHYDLKDIGPARMCLGESKPIRVKAACSH